MGGQYNAVLDYGQLQQNLQPNNNQQLFGESDIRQPYDACVLGSAPDARGLNVGPIIPSGYDACGTTLDARNLCFNVPGANTYECVCSPAYVRDISVPYDNCLKPLDSCDKRICVHGQCVTAPVRRCADGVGCVQDVAVEEETWLEFMDWTNYAMMITLGYIGTLAILLSIVGLCRKYRATTVDMDLQSKYSVGGSQQATFRSSRQSTERRAQKLSMETLQ
ncbi:unnamed protein product [Echinostoma caproni]|uniref:EGF-like domain-containing protein n=1 Tax=Echinostoma caproni TaxID=27848 RepID=A0A183BAI6_9TREM|nr:unnamed protein product [Echinostoma caproni]